MEIEVIASILLSRPILMLLVILSIWELIWKGIALWRCGRNNQLGWFVFILILNTAGILPVLYLGFFQKPKKQVLRTKDRRRFRGRRR